MNAVYIYYTPSWQPLADIVAKPIAEYCRRHNYINLMFENLFNEDWAYLKMCGLQPILTHTDYEFIWILDLDALITNHSIPFTDFTDNEHDIFITKDVNGINAGSWIMRNTQESHKFLNTIIQNFDAPHEQILMNRYLHMVKVKYLPHPSINSYDYKLYKDFYQIETNVAHDQGQWHPGDLLLHLPGLSLEKRIEVFKEMI